MGRKKAFQKSIIVVLCIIINLTGRYIAERFQLPVWLDTIGTSIAVYYTNVFGGLIAAVSINLIWGFADNISGIYILVGIVMVFLMRLCAKKGYWESFVPAMMSGLGIAVLASVVSTPIDLIFYNGYAGNIWGDALFDMLRFYGYPDVICAFAGECFINIVDKQIGVFIVYTIIQLNMIRKNGYQTGRDNRIKLLAIGIVSASVVMGFILLYSQYSTHTKAVTVAEEPEKDVDDNALAKAEKYIDFNEYVKVVYDSRNGLPSSEANAVAQTADGYIWIGGYAGLTRYDGAKFEYITEGGLSNVTAMLTDQKGRLWIGTNDRGIAVYENDSMSYITKEDGLTASSIRTLYEAPDGTIYAGTTSSLVRIDPDFRVEVVEGAPEGVVSVASCGDLIAGIDSRGSLFGVKNGELIFSESRTGRASYYSLFADGNKLYVGTTGSFVLEMKMDDNGKLILKKHISCAPLNSITRIQKTKAGVIWLSSDNGIGYLGENGKVHTLNYSKFDNSIECMMQDYEGNYWFASSRFGVMKLCRNVFTNIHESADKDGVVVNAVTGFDGLLYCGTDNGLQIIDPETFEFMENDVTEMIGTVRVRCLKTDSKNRLWICCYGSPGLVCVSSDGKIVTYNESENKTAGDRFRCILELEDGTIAVGSSSGITFIKDDAVVGTLTKEDGLETTQILTMVQAPDGSIYAGSDGSGIYVIKNRQLVTAITEEDGLTSPIILRMTPYENACFVVTSNSIGILQDGKVRTIKTFPYFNNFDIVIHDHEAWILTSRGIYIADVRELMADDFKYVLYDYNNGLKRSITANSWTYIDDNGCLYFCTNDGVEKIPMSRQKVYGGKYKMQITSVVADDRIVPEQDGMYLIDSDVKKISITPAICNFLLDDLKVCVYLEGMDKTPVMTRQSRLDTLVYTNVPGGSYTLHIQIFSDREEELVQEKVYRIVVKARMWEKGIFIVYLCIVLLGEVFFVSWEINEIRQLGKRRKELENMKAELEERVEEQTAEIRAQSNKMEKLQWGVIEGMATLIESRDGNTGLHVKNTSRYVRILAGEILRRRMYPDIVDEKFVEVITKVAPLHDVGKIKISDVILNKPGKFTKEEYEIMKQHSAMGGEIVGDILGKDADPYMVQMARDVATYHHERWDGSGYPTGLAGEEIPLAARIMAVADVFDAIISKRVYKEAMEIEEGFAELKRCAGTHFDPALVKVFLEIKEEVIREIIF